MRKRKKEEETQLVFPYFEGSILLPDQGFHWGEGRKEKKKRGKKGGKRAQGVRPCDVYGIREGG